MPTPTGRDRVLEVLGGRPPDRLPLWLMRQAGRFLPEYRAFRQQHSFLEVVRTPAWCTEVALQPLRRFPLDATIVFSDILVVPDVLGLGLRFVSGDGPSFERPVRTAADVDALTVEGALDRLGYVYQAVADLRRAAPDHALFGFAGSPWTLYCYAVQGEGSTDFARARALLWRDPATAERLLGILSELVAGHLERQLDAGADVVQVFDTWGGLLPADAYARFVLPGLRQLRARLDGRRVVLYVRQGAHLVELTRGLGFDALSVHETVDLAGLGGVTQGNLDPTLLYAPGAVRGEVERLVRGLGGRRTHLVNLGHGLLPDTPVEGVQALCDAVGELG